MSPTGAFSDFAGGELAVLSDEGKVTSIAPLSARHYKASPDDWAIDYWLKSCASKSANTRRAYRKEVVRWCAFLAAFHGDLTHNDYLACASYEDVARFITWIERDGDWPLPPAVAARYQLNTKQAAKPKASPVVLRQAVIILHGLYEELSAVIVPGASPQRKFCEFNPFKPYRKRFAKDRDGTAEEGGAPADALDDDADDGPDASGVAKALTDEAWAAVWTVACAAPAPDTTDLQRRKAARQRLVIAMLRATWERRHALAGMLWKHLRVSRGGLWKFRRKRKGKPAVWVAIPERVMEEIALFRSALGLPVAPQPEEAGRSIFWIGDRQAGREGRISDETIYRIVKSVFATAAGQLVQEDRADLVAELTRFGAGPHTIRHTMATQYLDAGGDIRQAQEALGHSSVVVTSRAYDSKHAAEQAAELDKQWANSAARALHPTEQQQT